MNAGKNHTKARAQAQANADRSQSPRWLHQYGGSWWISTTPTADAERINPRVVASRHHATKKTAQPADLFMGVFPTGISYADRARERNGDYLKLAFLPYDTLKLEWREPKAKVPPKLRAAILADARRMAARHGQEFPISAAGQTSTLGSKKSTAHSRIRKKSPAARLDREVHRALVLSLKPGAKIIANGYPGSVVRVTPYNMIEVRLPGGVAAVSAEDVTIPGVSQGNYP